MTPLDAAACYAALRARDSRFDGLFFVGVRTTGVYCRPICPARLPHERNCTFFASAAAAERAGYRACFRCRPELAPGRAAVDARSRLTRAATAKIGAGFLDRHRVTDLATTLGVSPRHLRRVLQEEVGVSPLELAQTRRLAAAKQLLQDTPMSISRVAHASGFTSLRRFNALFRSRFSRPPSAVRRGAVIPDPEGAVSVRLDYRPPLDWEWLLEFMGVRATEGVEAVEGDVYRRWVHVGQRAGWVRVTRMQGRDSLRAHVPVGLQPELPGIVAGLRRLFDLDARPDLISAHLGSDSLLKPLVEARPGLRVPGAFDPFEIAVRAVLGQQISVAAATGLCGRLVARFGDEGESTEGEAPAGYAFPSPDRLAGRPVEDVRSLGMPSSRARTVVELSRAVDSGRVDLRNPIDPQETAADLLAVHGIGPWTAEYILMRSLQWPDAFPTGDLGLRRALGVDGAAEVEARTRTWKPWRAYAAVHLWSGLTAQ